MSLRIGRSSRWERVPRPRSKGTSKALEHDEAANEGGLIKRIGQPSYPRGDHPTTRYISGSGDALVEERQRKQNDPDDPYQRDMPHPHAWLSLAQKDGA